MSYTTRIPPVTSRRIKSDLRLSRVDPHLNGRSKERSPDLFPRVLSETAGKLDYRQVLVLLDGSPYAEHAIPWAIEVATRAGARVRLVHIHQKMEQAFHSRGLNLYYNVDRLLRRPMEDYMAALTRRIARSSSVAVVPMLVDESHVNTGLAALTASADDMVVMATRGRSHLSRTIAGSGLDTVLNSRQAPILHIPGYQSPVDFSARPSLRHALVPLDGTLESERVLHPVADFSKLADGRQTLLRVMNSTGAFSCFDGSLYEATTELKEDPAGSLSDTSRIWRRDLPDMRTSIVWSDYPVAKEILTQADECEADFIAIATRDRSRLNRLLRPGVFDYLIRRSKVPVLVIKQPSGFS